ncbi:MAG: SpoIIE family protein phosphatase [bacterium]|jgi:serine phosphatase RsbU (regulator of sigma subunit)|nr:SpoIIE family protein phosphatase [bacterium]
MKPSKKGINEINKQLKTVTEELSLLEEKLRQREKELSAIYQAETIITSTLTIENLLAMINTLIIQVISCDRASILLLDDKRGDLLVTGTQENGENSDYYQSKRLTERGNVTRLVLEERKPLIITSRDFDDGFLISSKHYKTNSFISIPVFRNDEVKAILNVTDKWNGQDFNEEEIRLLEFLAAQISKTIVRFHLMEELVKTEQVSRELILAGELQYNIIPRQFPADERIDIAAYYLPAREMGGDFYDIFLADPDKLVMVMADVTGKGIPAAFFMSMVKSYIRGLGLKYVSPLTMFKALNSFLLEQNRTTPLYVTVFLGVLHLNSGTLIYASSGHEPPLLCRNKSREIQELPASGLMLGYIEDLHCHEHRIKLQSGDTLLLFTDGLKDMRNAANESFGLDRLKGIFENVSSGQANDIIDVIVEKVLTFRGETEPYDDLAAMVLRYRP